MLKVIRYVTLAFALVAAWPTAARANGVSWSTPAECPAKAKLLAGVTKHLGREIPDGIAIRGTIRRAKGGYTVTIHMGKGAVRAVTNRDCFLLTETASLIIALAIDEQTRAARTGAPSPARDSERPPAMVGPDPRATATASTTTAAGPSSRPPLRLRACAVFGAESGTLPKRTTGVGAGVSGQLGRLSLDLLGWYWMERSAPGMEPGSGGDVSQFYGALRLCAGLLHVAGTWGVCAVGNAGWMRVAGYGVDVPRTVYSGMISVGGAVQWSLRLQKRLYLRLDVQFMANLTRPAFVFQPGNELVFEPDVLSTRASAGVEMLIW